MTSSRLSSTVICTTCDSSSSLTGSSVSDVCSLSVSSEAVASDASSSLVTSLFSFGSSVSDDSFSSSLLQAANSTHSDSKSAHLRAFFLIIAFFAPTSKKLCFIYYYKHCIDKRHQKLEIKTIKLTYVSSELK